MKNWKALLLIIAVIIVCAFWIVAAEAADLPRVDLTVASAAPRQVEDSTEKSLARDYARAWQSMTTALSDNRTDVLDADFVGVALENLRERVQQQQKSGLQTRYTDRGHKLQAVFYSIDGSAIQLKDTAQIQVDFLDGSKVVHTEQRTESYTVVMSAAENRWKVRVLQAD